MTRRMLLLFPKRSCQFPQLAERQHKCLFFCVFNLEHKRFVKLFMQNHWYLTKKLVFNCRTSYLVCHDIRYHIIFIVRYQEQIISVIFTLISLGDSLVDKTTEKNAIPSLCTQLGLSCFLLIRKPKYSGAFEIASGRQKWQQAYHHYENRNSALAQRCRCSKLPRIL